jgi:signal transduction histidine kinase
MTTTVLIRSDGSPRGEATRKALREAGVGVVELSDWQEAADELRACEAALLVSGDALDAERFATALKALDAARAGNVAPLAPDAARALSHELRTPLSAMAGWVHLLETGKLDEAGIRRAASRLRGNIDDQVKTIERYLGANRQEGTRPT